MKKQTFTVTVTFADKVTADNEIEEVAKNIAKAIVDRSEHGMGIADPFRTPWAALLGVRLSGAVDILSWTLPPVDCPLSPSPAARPRPGGTIVGATLTT